MQKLPQVEEAERKALVEIRQFLEQVRDLGEHRLKDLVRSEHVFQLTHPNLLADFPPLKSLDSYPNNLPIQLTSFIGRDRSHPTS